MKGTFSKMVVLAITTLIAVGATFQTTPAANTGETVYKRKVTKKVIDGRPTTTVKEVKIVETPTTKMKRTVVRRYVATRHVRRKAVAVKRRKAVSARVVPTRRLAVAKPATKTRIVKRTVVVEKPVVIERTYIYRPAHPIRRAVTHAFKRVL